eukprot:11264532-Alexandrium_andersonii.AAC.1
MAKTWSAIDKDGRSVTLTREYVIQTARKHLGGSPPAREHRQSRLEGRMADPRAHGGHVALSSRLA